jgi:hypothetical protein
VWRWNRFVDRDDDARRAAVHVGDGVGLRRTGDTVGTGTTSVSMRTDQLLKLSTTRAGAVRDYHFRCVPPDFPRLDVTRPGNPSPGWYLTTSGFASRIRP